VTFRVMSILATPIRRYVPSKSALRLWSMASLRLLQRRECRPSWQYVWPT
jgi:hypothetical protein